MKKPLEITFRHMDPSPALEAVVRERAEKLERFCDRIIGCSVVIESPHKHHHKGNLHHLRIKLTVPGDEIVVQRSPDENHAHEDPYVVVRDAFDSVRRQLEDYTRKRRGAVKTHEETAHGRVTVLEPEEHYGRLETLDGRDIYFHRNSVVNADFADLKIGTELRFIEETGEQGTQASSVFVIGKHHPVP